MVSFESNFLKRKKKAEFLKGCIVKIRSNFIPIMIKCLLSHRNETKKKNCEILLAFLMKFYFLSKFNFWCTNNSFGIISVRQGNITKVRFFFFFFFISVISVGTIKIPVTFCHGITCTYSHAYILNT